MDKIASVSDEYHLTTTTTTTIMDTEAFSESRQREGEWMSELTAMFPNGDKRGAQYDEATDSSAVVPSGLPKRPVEYTCNHLKCKHQPQTTPGDQGGVGM